MNTISNRWHDVTSTHRFTITVWVSRAHDRTHDMYHYIIECVYIYIYIEREREDVLYCARWRPSDCTRRGPMATFGKGPAQESARPSKGRATRKKHKLCKLKTENDE